MRNTSGLSGNKKLIFVLEYGMVTGGMLHSVTSLLKEIQHHFQIIIICPKGQLAIYLKELSLIVIELGDIDFWQSKKLVDRFKLLTRLNTKISQNTCDATMVITNNIYAQLLVSICSYFTPFKIIYFNRGGDLKNLISKLVIRLSHNLTLVLSTSTNQRNIVDKSGLLKNGAKNIILHNPVILEHSIEFPSNRFKANRQFIIGNVGFIDQGKNQLLAIESVAKLRKKNMDVCLEIYGEANNQDYLSSLHQRIDELKISDYVTFKGFVTNKATLYQNIDLLLSTSLAEGFGRTLVEAMLAKRPVVALAIAGGPVDIIRSTDHGLLVADNSDSVANAIKLLLCNEVYRNNVVNNAYEYASKNFNPKTIASNFIAILEKELV